MKILMVSPFINPYENSSNRVEKLKRFFEKNNFNTHLITTNFDHAKKEAFSKNINRTDITHINVPNYKKNISIKRFYSHTVFAFKLLRYLFSKNNDKKFDVIYCTVPTSLASLACILYGKKNHIKVMVDVIDLWPNSFLVILPFKSILNILLTPWYLTSFIVYRFADKLFAESHNYAKYIQKFNNETVDYVNLGIDNDLIKRNIINSKLNIKKNNEKIYICYAGSLGNSYDFDVILNALKKLKDKGKDNYHFLFIGGGDKEEYIKEYINKYNLSAEITGFLTYKDYIKQLSICDIGINSFNRNTKVVYSYKFNDYLGVGLAVLNNLKGETESIISTHQLGYTFDYEKKTLESKLEVLLTNKDILKNIKENSLQYAKEIGNYEVEYQKFIDYIEGNLGL